MHLREIPGIKTNEAVFGIIINFDENIFLSADFEQLKFA